MVGTLATYNINFGFVEALVRGMRSSFLKDEDYHHITLCDTLEDIKLNLQETDYCETTSSIKEFSPNSMQMAALNKLADDIRYLRSQAVPPLSTFLDLMVVEYHVENVIVLLKGSQSGRSIPDMMSQLHPLGMFDVRFCVVSCRLFLYTI